MYSEICCQEMFHCDPWVLLIWFKFLFGYVFLFTVPNKTFNGKLNVAFYNFFRNRDAFFSESKYEQYSILPIKGKLFSQHFLTKIWAEVWLLFIELLTLACLYYFNYTIEQHGNIGQMLNVRNFFLKHRILIEDDYYW